MFYFLVSFIVFFVSTFLFRRAAGTLSLTKPNMISFIYYWELMAMTFLGSVLVILMLDDHYVISKVSTEARKKGWLAVMYTMVVVPIGMLLAKCVWLGEKKVSLVLSDYADKKIDLSGVNGNSLKYSVWIFTFLSFLACLYTFYKIRYFPFLKAITTSGSTLDILRIDSSRNFSGIVYVKNIFGIALMPLLSYVWAFYYIANKSLADGFMFFITFIMSASILYYDFSKSPLLWYILSYIFVYYYAGGKLKFNRLLILSVVSFFVLIVMYSIRGVGLNDFASYNTGPIGRVVLGQVAGTYYIFDLFPMDHDFIGFSSLSQFLSNLLGYEYIERAARIAMMSFNPVGVDEGTAGVMNSLFVAEAWANFGFIGVLISPLWVGFLIGSLYYFFLNKKKNPLWLALFVSFSFGGSFTGGFNDYIYNGKFIVLIALVGAILLTALLFWSFRGLKVLNENNLPSSSSTRPLR